MNEIIYEILQKYWGYSEFRPMQEEIITSLLDGHDTLGLMPTGGGKSLTFQVPTLSREGLCLVITPLVALMKDQVDNLRDRGIRAAYIHAGMSRREMVTTFDNCLYGRFKFLYISPERLDTELFTARIKGLPVSFIVVDEAHCISQWGYDFRPSYLKIAAIRHTLPHVPVLALTATATPQVAEDIQQKLDFRNGRVFRTDFSRPNLSYVVRQGEDKIQQLLRILHRVPGSAIVYVRNRKRTKEIAGELRKAGISADYFHAGLGTEEKNEKQRKWKEDETRVMVSTNAFGMGIDKPDVRAVVHIDMPNAPEEYFQEAGRAGRDGARAYAVLLYSRRDKANLHKRLTEEFPDKEFILKVYERVSNFLEIALGCGMDSIFEFNLKRFCSTFNYMATPVLNALKILSISGYIEFIEETDSLSRVMILVRKEELYELHETDPATDRVLQCLLRSYTGLFADYTYIHEDILSQRLEMSQQEVYEALLKLNRLHVLHYIPRRRTPYIIYTRERMEPRYVQITREAYEERRQRMSDRIESMIAYASSSTRCRQQMLLEYFGEKSDYGCGCCDNCIERKKRERHSNETPVQIARAIREYIGNRTINRAQIAAALPYPENEVMEALRFLQD
ncbi:MAG TPA: RecQ family ATP-dependent DNA helicase, partial [Candidatus Barnesiella excrementigallinarum]|nr:RecQ family ATP-dependent DNA helicase [Candidatus Barnesiella excrementigallinarum]